MITRDQAFHADVFHIEHAGLPCTVWHRAGVSYEMPEDGFFVPVFRNDDPGNWGRTSETWWHHITRATAGDFHAADDCPEVRKQGDDRPPASDRSELQPMLSVAGYDADGYDANGYDANGYDSDGYDSDGYDSDGYDANGYDSDGNPQPGSLDASDLDLAELWAAFRPGRWNTSLRQADFRQHLRELVSDPDSICELSFCYSCDSPAWDDDTFTTGDAVSVCESCWDDLPFCDSCDERFQREDLNEMLSGSDVCDSCRDSYYTWCDHCDGYYNDSDSYEHEHEGGGCCESPQTRFAVRNDGEEPLANDTRATITLPAGTISAEGLKAIRDYLRDQGHYDVSYDVAEIGDQWQTRQGNFSKRLSRYAYQTYQAKLTPDVLSQVGCIARDHSNAVDVSIEVTRDLNMPASEFYHEDSCWWGSYYESRCALKTNGGIGLRSFDSSGGVSGRAWIMPLRKTENGKLAATFETMTPDAFVVFNGYGDLSGYAPARIAAHMAGWTYRKIDFYASPMYINAGGYLIAPEDIAEQYTDGELYLHISQHSNLFETEKELVNA
jgi:hypothetical protein